MGKNGTQLSRSTANVVLSRGLDDLGARSQNPNKLFRDAAESDFTKLEFSIERLQRIDHGWLLLMRSAGQVASGTPLFRLAVRLWWVGLWPCLRCFRNHRR